MAYALVGSAGTAITQQGAPQTPSYGQTPTANNLLICWASALSGISITTPTGWSVGISDDDGVSSSLFIFYKIAAGSDAQPTITGSGSPNVWCQLAEFSGNATSSPLDQTGANHATSSPTVATNGAADAASGELLIMLGMYKMSKGGSSTSAHAPNNGASDNNTANQDSDTVNLNHIRYTYGITTGNSSADNDSFSDGSMNLTNIHVVIASFKLPSGFQPRNPAVNFQDPAVLSRRWVRDRLGLLWPERPRLWLPV
jgi:hypothetical protein